MRVIWTFVLFSFSLYGRRPKIDLNTVSTQRAIKHKTAAAFVSVVSLVGCLRVTDVFIRTGICSKDKTVDQIPFL